MNDDAVGPGTARAMADIKMAAAQVVELANQLGVVVTITDTPLEPLAMGNTVSVIDVRPRRKLTEHE